MTDLSIRLLRDGYAAVSKDRRAGGGGATYASHLLGQRTIVLGDASGAAVFYDESLVARVGAGASPTGLAALRSGSRTRPRR